MTNFDKEIERLDEGGEGWDEEDEIVELEVKEGPLDKVIPIRLSAEEWNELRKEAGELGVGPAAFARAWILAIDQIREKYSSDPEGLTSYMPEVAKLLSGEAFHEGNAREESEEQEASENSLVSKLNDSFELLERKSLTREEAIIALEICAKLIVEDDLPEEANYDRLTGLLTAFVKRPIDSFQSTTTIERGDDEASETDDQIALVRGVTLNLDSDMRLISITVTPEKVKQREKLLSFVGIGHDTASDVSIRHDDYLAEQNPHAST